MNATDNSYINFTEAAKLVPQGTSTQVWRWARCGLKRADGSRRNLTHVRVGARLYTTAEWVHQFIADLAQDDIQARAKRAG